MRCLIAPGKMVTSRVRGVLLYGAGVGGVICRCPWLQIVVGGVEGDGVVMFPAVERKEGVEAMPGVPGPAGVACGCRFQEGVHGTMPRVFPEKVVLWAPLIVAPFRLPPTLEGRVMR